MSGGRSDAVWSEQDTSPGKVEAALRRLVVEKHAEHEGYVPARTINMVCVVDRDWSGEVANRLKGVGRYHAGRTIVLALERRRTQIDAVADVVSEGEPEHGRFVLLRETVVLHVGDQHVAGLRSIVDPLVVTDIPTVVWSPHGHPEAVDALLPVAQSVMWDSVAESDPASALARAAELAERAYVVDLAWLRGTPWRERVAAYFDPVPARRLLSNISKVTVRHAPGSEAGGMLFLGWLSSRLGWKPGDLVRHDGSLMGKASARRQEVRLELRREDQDVPGLAGVTIETADGASIALDRGAGGLSAKRTAPDGRERCWTILGASRGEGGILGEGIRQALLRNPTYGPALGCARMLAG
jgi:glucose-6-phosphate dehydrogenase assembly protein OpcA